MVLLKNLRELKVIYKQKKIATRLKLEEYGNAKAPEVDTIQNELDSLRREV